MCRDQWSSEPFVWQPLNEDFKLVPWVAEHFTWSKRPLSLSTHTYLHFHHRVPVPCSDCHSQMDSDYISLMALFTWYSSQSVTVLSHCGHQTSLHRRSTAMFSIRKTTKFCHAVDSYQIAIRSHTRWVKKLNQQSVHRGNGLWKCTHCPLSSITIFLVLWQLKLH